MGLRRAPKVLDLLLVDHRDSFTWNLVHLLRGLGASVEVVDQAQADPERLAGADALVLGPGPHGPCDVPASLALARTALERRLPTLGVCLGHQILAVACGGRVRRATRVAHGVVSAITHDGLGLFRGQPRPARFVRYHSLVVQEPLPATLGVTARDEEGDVAALRHLGAPAWGIQFHPESALSTGGDALLGNFLRVAGGPP